MFRNFGTRKPLGVSLEDDTPEVPDESTGPVEPGVDQLEQDLLEGSEELGEGIDNDLLLADLVITDPVAIEYINKELPEVSAGYEAEYEQTEPGRGVQREIVGNHTALVLRGRAGPRHRLHQTGHWQHRQRPAPPL